MLTYVEKENLCAREFAEYGPFWHLYTNGTKMENLFSCDEDTREGMNALAVTAVLFRKVRIITFELMSNHVHLILAGAYDDCLELFHMFKMRLVRLFRTKGKYVDWTCFEADILGIETIKALRNEIIYVHRNAFVANPIYTPCNYPWGGGWAYFSPVIRQLHVKFLKELGFNRGREITHFRDLGMLTDLAFVDDVAFIPSFCSIDIGERMFHDARSYFYSLTRNAEAFSQIASRLKDSIFLTDNEIYAVAVKYSDESFGNKQLTLLTAEQKIHLCQKLHFDYNATNQQLRRILKLDLNILNELFP